MKIIGSILSTLVILSTVNVFATSSLQNYQGKLFTNNSEWFCDVYTTVDLAAKTLTVTARTTKRMKCVNEGKFQIYNCNGNTCKDKSGLNNIIRLLPDGNYALKDWQSEDFSVYLAY